MLRVRQLVERAKRLPQDPDLAFCYDMLNRVSRSFAVVIQQLGPELRDAICLFYLVLRGLDTVEDSMDIPVVTKLPILLSFHKTMYDPTWTFPCGENHYKRLMDNYPCVTRAFLRLNKQYQEVIADITRRMGAGMAKYIEKEVVTRADFDEYCHYVAGLVGLGLSGLFEQSGLEERAPDELSNSMGLFLQKTNIVRDYLEDINEEPAPRMFWPRDVWSKYGEKLEEFREPAHREAAVHCANDLITETLRHVPHSLRYMAALRDPLVFGFCAIPQIMAIGTLALCYNNPAVFTGVVKLRRGLSAKVMDRTKTMEHVYRDFLNWTRVIKRKVTKTDPNAEATIKRCEKIEKLCLDGLAPYQRSQLPAILLKLFIILLLAVVGFRLSATGLHWEGLGLALSLDAETVRNVVALLLIAIGSLFVLGIV
ncbi:squalene synthase [Klebsormidium nitens]|uniref:Squalene synthase n=1 Tax=Klebsormidium nitens TaxID=105231 RepID=A0A1Y1ITX8_KLENI|nr:squalene synthase [Klebsormidium nitens]|eukprot:GAQ93019.1 squalene synthase [Klebsormidium nitens]